MWSIPTHASGLRCSTMTNSPRSLPRSSRTLYLDVTPEVGLKRARARGELDRIEQESFDFFNRTRARYLELAAQDKSIHTIDATQPLEAVMDAIRTTVTHWVKELDA